MLEEGADAAKVEQEIKTMPNYFADYDTTVHFISEEELKRDHSGIPHGGFVLRSGVTGWEKEHKQPGIYFLRDCGLRKSRLPSCKRRTDWLPYSL